MLTVLRVPWSGGAAYIDTYTAPPPWAGNCRVEGFPILEGGCGGGLAATTLPTMESAIITYDPFNRPRARGWHKKPWRFIALNPDEGVEL